MTAEQAQYVLVLVLEDSSTCKVAVRPERTSKEFQIAGETRSARSGPAGPPRLEAERPCCTNEVFSKMGELVNL